ncbi:MAG: hypothetical protein UW24_C0003G0029 [Parcubacteria group bacterium GW2011_GWA2_44_12]|nr:MAG: hypothetical protein UW24_C0003G0029 [Parcubacteria group bacterium GW2011_GWA2_44_12]
MLILTIITYGIYIPVWFLNRKDTFNNLNSKEKISNGTIIFALVIFIISAIALILSLLFMETKIGAMFDEIDSLVNLVGGITILAMSFKVRWIMKEHYKINLSGIATFFFIIFYLQYKINRLPHCRTSPMNG